MRINTLESSIAEHQPLPDKIANFVREAIIVGKLKPGEKISEAKLADEQASEKDIAKFIIDKQKELES